ncbi:peptidoglycan DD-metalloendopeptidase family protein [Flavobacterium sp.]|uniref:peptidoglycan DD-metalloendopeptidase family protein n=1 Tax=Flavobacterium sp. TaxID=239 RepID=UPI003750968C
MNKIKSLFENLKDVKVIDSSIDYSYYIAIDLSVSNKELSKLNITDALAFENYIEEYLTKNSAKVAFGGYQEIRNLYKRSTVFNAENSEERNIHIGLDLWIKAGTSVLAALDGTIHSFQNNTALGDYGPTIIMEHQLDEIKFYTLYGHLSLDSLTDKQIGTEVKKGETIATLGSPPTNGDYAPHLHFQIIIDIENKTGDYPGVCNENKLKFYSENCPNPNLLLKIQ